MLGLTRGGRRPRAALLVVLVAASGLGWWWFGSDGGSKPRVRTAPVQRRDVVQVVEANGRLHPERPFSVTAGVEGWLQAIEVEEAEAVRAGQVLARLDAQRLAFDEAALKASRAAARARASQAVVALEEAETALKRIQRLEARGQASAAELESAGAEHTRAQALVRATRAEAEAASARFEAARLASQRAALVAPRDGVVLRVVASVGSRVGPTRPPVFELAEALDPLMLRVEVGEAEVGRLKPGQPARFEVPAHPGERFEGTVLRIGLVADVAGGLSMYPVTVRAPNPGIRLRPGMTAAVAFEVARAEDALVVREAALRYTPEGAPPAPPRSRVFVWRETGLVPVSVEQGLTEGAYSEVRSLGSTELRPGDEVAIGEALGGEAGRPAVTLGGGE